MLPLCRVPPGSVAAARDGQRPRADHLLQSQGFQQTRDGVDLVLPPGDLDDERTRRDVHDLAAEDLHDAQHLGPGLGQRRNLEHRQLPPHEVRLADVVLDGHHVDQLVELLGDLLDGLVVAVGDQGDARDLGIQGGRDVQTVDVVAAAAEHADHARQHAELVAHQDGDGVTHSRP